ncbi:MAG: GFA family protein [Pseudomonadota bacterium]
MGSQEPHKKASNTKDSPRGASVKKPVTLRGGCFCGAVRYRCDASPDLVFCCHCLDCQRHSAGPFAFIVRVDAAALEITGKTQTYAYGAGGQGLIKHFCPICGTRMLNEVARFPDHRYLAGGTLDEGADMIPSMHIYTRRCVSWFTPNEGADIHS